MAISVNKDKGGRPSKQPSKKKVEYAIKSTQSMRMAAEYINLSYQTFRKYAKLYDLWKPLPSSKGVRKRNSTKVSPFDLKKILTGENPSPYRETVLLKKAFTEGYLAMKCSNCDYDCTHITDLTPPLVLDFLDKNHNNTHLDNLRVLCLNCIYTLASTQKGWYRHRDVPLVIAIDDLLEKDIEISTAIDDIIPENIEDVEPNTDILSDDKPELEYIPFEEFQKTLQK
tara:strand:+ start:345 stop:1025 length:681 start_codon:yes stop_codon:yes gene_type:complete